MGALGVCARRIHAYAQRLRIVGSSWCAHGCVIGNLGLKAACCLQRPVYTIAVTTSPIMTVVDRTGVVEGIAHDGVDVGVGALGAGK